MNPDTLRVILTSASAVLLGGGGLQLILFLLRRRPELRKLDTAADVDQATAADTLINRLQQDGATHRQQVRDLHEKVQRLEDRYVTAQADFTSQLRDAHAENVRLATRVAQLQTDLDIAGRQITELRRRLGST